MQITGYKRPDGSYGIRNHLLVIPASVCATHVAKVIADQVPGAVYLMNEAGCCQVGDDFHTTVRTLTNYGLNPNAGAVLLVGLGCEGVPTKDVAAVIAKTGKPVKYVIIQEEGGTMEAVAKGARFAAEMQRELSDMKRVSFDISELTVALECGGSDPTSGIASNPAIGVASCKLVKLGGSAILSETTECIGAEDIIAERFVDKDEGKKFLKMVLDCEQRAIHSGGNLREGQPTPGNVAGGLTTIEEKSLGCMHKAGDAAFVGALGYADLMPKDKRGMFFMDTPGQDIDSITGMVAGGAQAVLFSTGRGTPTGNPIAPVIKITGNNDTYKKMSGDLDVNAGVIITEGKSVAQVGDQIFDLLVEVCNGKQTKAESLGHQEFALYRNTGSF